MAGGKPKKNALEVTLWRAAATTSDLSAAIERVRNGLAEFLPVESLLVCGFELSPPRLVGLAEAPQANPRSGAPWESVEVPLAADRELYRFSRAGAPTVAADLAESLRSVLVRAEPADRVAAVPVPAARFDAIALVTLAAGATWKPKHLEALRATTGPLVLALDRAVGPKDAPRSLPSQLHSATPAAAAPPGGPPPISPAGSHGEDATLGVCSLDQAMADHIRRALEACHGRIEGPFGAAKLLEINPHTLRARMRKLGVPWSEFRPKRARKP